jgi:hypothetical protein
MPIFEVATRVEMFVVPVTFIFVVVIFDVFIELVQKALPMTYRFVSPDMVPIPTFDPATSVDVLDVPLTFKFVPKIEAALREVELMVERFEPSVVLRVVAKRLAAFMTKEFPLTKTFRVAMFANV